MSKRKIKVRFGTDTRTYRMVVPPDATTVSDLADLLKQRKRRRLDCEATLKVLCASAPSRVRRSNAEVARRSRRD